MINATSLATKGVISPSSLVEQISSGGGGGFIIREECVKPKIKVLSFEIDSFRKNKLIITSIKYT